MNRTTSRAKAPRRWAWAGWVFGLLALAALIVVGLHVGDLEQFLILLHDAQPVWLIAAFALQVVTYVVNARVWFLALRKTHTPRGMRTLVALCVSKFFTDQVFPTGGISGSILVVGQLVRTGIPAEAAMAALLVGMIGYYGAYALMAAATLLLLWLHHGISRSIIEILLLFIVVAISIPAIALRLKRLGKLTVWSWPKRIPGFATLLSAVVHAPSGLLTDRALIAEAVFFQAMVFLADAATLWVTLASIGWIAQPHVPFIAMIMACISSTLSPIPLGLGTFEAVATGSLVLLGVKFEAALTAVLLLRGFTFWLPLAPGLWLTRTLLAAPEP
jgi:uncharacterized protein (TIRG00374 family)